MSCLRIQEHNAMRYSITNTTIEQVKSAGAKNIKTPSRVPVVFAELTPSQVAKLQSMGCIVSKIGKVSTTVSPPIPVAATPTYTIQGLIEATGFEDLRYLMDPILFGERTCAAVLDTGIRETHSMLGGRVVYSKNYTTSPMRDGFNHGTGVASIVIAVAPKGSILNMKVLDDEGVGTEEEVVLAIDDCISLHDTRPDIAPSVINLSLGAEDDGNPNSPLRIACRAAIEKGIWVDAAAGNGGPSPGTITSPATERYVFAIGSMSLSPFALSAFSSRGPTKEGLIKPDTASFGEDIILASNASDTATVARSGTSFSTPFYAGVTLLLHEAIARGGVRYIGEETIPVLLTEITEVLSVQDFMDNILPRTCVKPEGVPAGRDNDYGLGMPYGPLVLQVLGAVPAVAIGISSLIGAVVMIGMMGVMMKVMK